jgi:type I restriction enzyme M protein
MAVANHIGHDKRGNVTYVRDDQGFEIVNEVEETLKDYREGLPIYKRQLTKQKVVDDNTLQIAQEFRSWLSEQD